MEERMHGQMMMATHSIHKIGISDGKQLFVTKYAMNNVAIN